MLLINYIFSYLKIFYKKFSNFYIYKIFSFYICYFIDNFFFSYFGPIYKNSWLSGQFIQGTPSFPNNIKTIINIKDNIGDSLNNMELFLFFNKTSWSFLAELNSWIGGRFFSPKVYFTLLTPFSKIEKNNSIFCNKTIKKKRIYSYHILFLQKFLYIKFIFILSILNCLIFYIFFLFKFYFIINLFIFFISFILILHLTKVFIINEYRQYKLGLYLFIFKNYEICSEFDFIPGLEFNSTEEKSIIKIYNNFKKDFNNRFFYNLNLKKSEKNQSDFLKFWHYAINNIHNLSLASNLKKTKKNFFYLYNKSKKDINNLVINSFLLNTDIDLEEENIFVERNQVNLKQKFQSDKLINTFFDYFYRRLEKKFNRINSFFFVINLFVNNPSYYWTIHKSKQYLMNLSYFFFKNNENKKFNLNFYIIFYIINISYSSKNNYIKNAFFIHDILIVNSDITQKSIINFFSRSNNFLMKEFNTIQKENISLNSYKKLLYYENNIGIIEKTYNNIIITHQYIIYLKYIKENPINIKRLNQQIKKQYIFLQNTKLKNTNINSLFFGSKIINEITSQNILFRNLYFYNLNKNILYSVENNLSIINDGYLGKEYTINNLLDFEKKLIKLNIKILKE